MKFNELSLTNEVLQGIEDLGFEDTMPVQEKCIPFIINETKDLVALAQTGTGKTAAYGLPLLHLIKQEPITQALILSPTRELCIQITNDLKSYAKYMKWPHIVPVYGGENIMYQFKKLDKTPQIIVATPGRLMDLMRRGKIQLENIKYLVLDEADEMLNMGFEEDITTILSDTPKTRRTFLFSATMPNEIVNISKKHMNERKEISIGKKNAGAENVEHIYYMVSAKDRYLALKRVVDLNPDIYGIVFCRTREETKDISNKLMQDGYNADALHGDLSQAQRDSVMRKFRLQNLQLLVATDVAARGLDVSNLTHIINYNLPDDIEIYTHRSGRTGRAFQKGVSIAIIHSKEKSKISKLEKMLGKQFYQKPIPNGIDVCKKQLFHLIDKMEKVDETLCDIELDTLWQQIFKKLDYIDKETIVKKMVALEFSRFLEYYQDAPDLNIQARASEAESKRGKMVRLKIDKGENDGYHPRRLLTLINDAMQNRSVTVNNIEVASRYTFFDVFQDQAEAVVVAIMRFGEFRVDEVKGRRDEGTKGRKGEWTKGRMEDGTKGRKEDGAKSERRHWEEDMKNARYDWKDGNRGKAKKRMDKGKGKKW